MSESNLCRTLRNTLLNHQNALQPARTKVHRVNAEIMRLEKLISDIENQIRIAEQEATIMGAARKLGKRLGPLVAVLGKTEAAIRLSRLKSDKLYAKADLDRAKTELMDAEEKVDEYIYGINLTSGEMQREGCKL